MEVEKQRQEITAGFNLGSNDSGLMEEKNKKKQEQTARCFHNNVRESRRTNEISVDTAPVTFTHPSLGNED